MKSFFLIKTIRLIGSLTILLITILTMILMSGCAASLTDFGYEGGPTTTVIPNKRINDGYGEPSAPFFGFDGRYNPKLTIYYPYSGTFSSSRQYWPK